MGFAGSDAFASLSFPFSLRRGPPPKFGGANDKLDRLFYDSIARRRHCTYQRAARYEIMEWEVAERFGKWRNVPEYSETALEG